MSNKREISLMNAREHVFERPVGQRNYMVNEGIKEPAAVLVAINDLIKEMKAHAKEREQINADIARLNKFGGVTDSTKTNERIKQQQAVLKRDFQAYAASVIDLLARAGLTQPNFKITTDLINKSNLSPEEKKDVKAFIHASMQLYSMPVIEYIGTSKMKVNDVKQRVTQTFGMADTKKEEDLLNSLGYKQQAVEVKNKGNTLTTFALKTEPATQKPQDTAQKPTPRKIK